MRHKKKEGVSNIPANKLFEIQKRESFDTKCSYYWRYKITGGESNIPAKILLEGKEII